MYFKICINGEEIGTYGHEDAANLSVSVQSMEQFITLFANGVCREDGKQFVYSWLQRDLTADDVVEIRCVQSGTVPSPKTKYEMQRKSSQGAS